MINNICHVELSDYEIVLSFLSVELLVGLLLEGSYYTFLHEVKFPIVYPFTHS